MPHLCTNDKSHNLKASGRPPPVLMQRNRSRNICQCAVVIGCFGPRFAQPRYYAAGTTVRSPVLVPPASTRERLQWGLSVAAKKGTSLAGETEPVVRLRSELLQGFGGLGLVESVGRAFSVGRVSRSRLPCGNFWLPLGNWAHLPTHRSQFIILEVPREVKENCGSSVIGLNLSLPTARDTALLPRVGHFPS
jgi:hypothetical protein